MEFFKIHSKILTEEQKKIKIIFLCNHPIFFIKILATYCNYILNINFYCRIKLLNISSFILEKHPVFLRSFLVNRHQKQFKTFLQKKNGVITVALYLKR